MGTKESISYKMISHGSWYRQIQRKKEEEQQPRRGEERKEEGKQQPSQEKDTEEGSTQEKKEVQACVNVTEKGEGKGGRESEMEGKCVEEGEKRTSKSNKQI